MDVQSLLENDYLHWTYFVPVRVTGQREGGDVVQYVSHACPLDLTRAQRIFGGNMQFAGDERVWIIPRVLIPNLREIEPEDFIHDLNDDVVYTVNIARGVRAGTQFVCVTTKQR